jgi:hypothetical protein
MGNTQAVPTTDALQSADRSELRQIERPHPDIELGVPRAPLDYLVCAPNRGIDADTGLVLFFVGYGMEPGCDYVRRLLSYLADKHNCLAVSVDYFGADLWGKRKCRWMPGPDFFVNLKQHHGIEASAPKGFDVHQQQVQLAELLATRGVKQLHPTCAIVGISPEYNSMGLLPALDGLQVAHRLIDSFALNKRRLFVLGTSYGGYIANLMAKFAPQTFRMVIDNSGFSSAEDDIGNLYGQSHWHYWRNGFTIRSCMVASFSDEPGAAHYFSRAYKEIRNLLNRAHVFDSAARLYGYHAISDEVAPTAKKLGLRAVYADKIPYELEIIDPSKIDGRVFKDLSHGMRASLRGVFDRSYDKFVRDGGARGDSTDFDLESHYKFLCGEKDYLVSFSRRDGVQARLLDAA